MIRILGLSVACFIFQSYPTLATITVPFLNGMRLGSAFDYSKFEVGSNLIKNDVRDKAVERRHDMSCMKFRLIKTQKDVRDVLDVSGELSVKVMAGLVGVKGKGSFLKSSLKNENTVEVLAQIYHQTVTKTITDDVMIPMKNWRDKIKLGRHYVRSISYGGYLIASLKFTPKKNVKKEDIRASIEVNGNTKKVNVGVKGQVKSLAESADSIANLEVSYTSSEIAQTTSVDLDTILQVIEDFPSQIRNSENGIGVPIEVEIRELMYLQGGNDLEFVANGFLAGKVDRFAAMFADLQTTYEALNKLVTDPKQEGMSERVAKIYEKLRAKIGNIKRVFLKTIDKLDLNEKTGNMDELENAFEAYIDGDQGFVRGKYSRQLKRVQKMEPSPKPGEAVLRKAKEEAKYRKTKEQLEKNITKMSEEISSLESLLSGEEVTINFPEYGDPDARPHLYNYMTAKGAPEMDSVMACGSVRTSGRGSYGHSIQGDGNWHSWCFYWDDSGKTIAYKDGKNIGMGMILRSKGVNVTAGGTWYIGQNVPWTKNAPQIVLIVGEVKNVNVYANFDRKYFQNVVAPAITSNTCRPKIYNNIIKSWDDFKLGLVGTKARASTHSSC